MYRLKSRNRRKIRLSKGLSSRSSVRAKAPEQETGEIVRQHLAALLGAGTFQRRLVQGACHRLTDDARVIGRAGPALGSRTADDFAPFLAPARGKRHIGPAFGINYRGIGHGCAQDAGMTVGTLINSIERGRDRLLQTLAGL